jgi:hypothetical protein
MEHRAFANVIAKILGRPLTDAEMLDVEERVSRYLKLSREQQPTLSEQGRLVEVGRSVARELVENTKQCAARLERRLFEADNSPNPLMWPARDRLALVAAVVLCAMLSTVLGFVLERRGYYSVTDWITDSVSSAVWLSAGALIGAAVFYLIKFAASELVLLIVLPHSLSRGHDHRLPANVHAADAGALAGFPTGDFVNLAVFKAVAH